MRAELGSAMNNNVVEILGLPLTACFGSKVRDLRILAVFAMSLLFI